MPVIFSNTTDGRQSSGIIPAWNTAHDLASGAQTKSTSETRTAFFGPRAALVTGRGSDSFYLVRTFFDFNVSGISGTVASADFSLKTFTNGGTDTIVVQSGHDPSDTSTHWFSTWLTGLGGSISGWGSSDATAFSSATTMASNGSYTDYTLNAAALSHLNSVAGTSNPFKIAVLNYDFDYLDVQPTGIQLGGVYWADSSGTSSDPHLDYTLGAAGYGQDVAGVATADIETVIGVATGDIEKVIGVD